MKTFSSILPSLIHIKILYWHFSALFTVRNPHCVHQQTKYTYNMNRTYIFIWMSIYGVYNVQCLSGLGHIKFYIRNFNVNTVTLVLNTILIATATTKQKRPRNTNWWAQFWTLWDMTDIHFSYYRHRSCCCCCVCFYRYRNFCYCSHVCVAYEHLFIFYSFLQFSI